MPTKRKSTKSQKKPSEGLLSNWRSWLLAALLIGGVILAALHWGDVKKFGELMTKARPLWLAVAAGFQLLTYLGLAAQWWLVLHRADTKEHGASLVRLTFAKHFADQVIPTAGVSGNVLLVDRLVAMGVARKYAVAALILQIVAYYVSYAAGALWVLVVLWWKSRSTALLTASVMVFLVVAIGIPVLVLWLHKRGQERIPRPIRRWAKAQNFFKLVGEAPRDLVRDPWLIFSISALNALVFIADVATMHACLLALGIHAPLGASYVAFMMATIAVILGPIPMGLGSYEAVSIAMLRLFGVPFEAALSSTLLFRGFTLWLPLIPGGILLRREMKRSSK